MLLKERTKSVTHRLLESLNFRMNLPAEEKVNYENQVKGFAGEKQFDAYMNQSNQSGLVLNDLVLTYRNTVFQIDSLLITTDVVYLYEVKNYAGPYFYREESFFTESGYKILNPLRQIDRSATFLHNVLLSLGYQLPIQPLIVFINPEFNLYSLLPNKLFLFSNQLPKYLHTLSNQNFSTTNKQLELGKKLSELHNETYRPDKLPNYDFDQLKKGILCPVCFSASYRDTRQTYFCAVCAHKETITSAIERSILEFRLLFPDSPITTNRIYQWCGASYSKERIRLILKMTYRRHLSRQMTYYSEK
ncbi:nuclease-related domain-containing protein [Carnobacterium pleistocenium]|uniref:nuclease-related domain-containing protein n=1 Tax=Carnobacterium pleistocenium TaxID=181073 RepID=UPI000554EDCE|nr:nuclease-related domain-containing protein [Carnobacterium pleistocenium]